MARGRRKIPTVLSDEEEGLLTPRRLEVTKSCHEQSASDTDSALENSSASRKKPRLDEATHVGE